MLRDSTGLAGGRELGAALRAHPRRWPVGRDEFAAQVTEGVAQGGHGNHRNQRTTHFVMMVTKKGE
jgi:hypothetical protein